MCTSRAPALEHHLHDLLRGRAAHDAVVDQHDAIAAHGAGVGRVLELDAELADALLGLDEGAADVVVADDAELERDAALLRIADGGGHAGIGDRDDHVGLGRRFARQLRAHLLAHVVHVAAADDGVGPREVDVLEDARPRRAPGEGPMALDAVGGDGDDFAVLDLAHELGADDVERAGLRRQHLGLAQLPSTSGRMPMGSRAPISMSLVRHDEGVGALDLQQRLDEALDDAPALRAGDEVQDDLGVGGRLADGARGDQLAPQRQRVGQVAVVGDGKAAGIEIGEQRLHVAQDGVAGGRVAVVAERRCGPSGGR